MELIGVEAAGKGVDTEEHAASMTKGTPGVLHGTRSYLLQDEDGNIQLAHSISAGWIIPESDRSMHISTIQAVQNTYRLRMTKPWTPSWS